MTDQPNILVIMTDQQRGDCLSWEDHPCLLTPNMDHIAGRGSHFARAYSTCPSCIPARRAMLTGQYPATNGMVGYREGFEFHQPTLPGELKKAGYQTVLVGRSMHQHPPRKRYGFNEMIVQDGRDGIDDYQRDLMRDHPEERHAYRVFGMTTSHGISGNGWTARPWHYDESLHPTTWTVAETEKFLHTRDSTTPYFAIASFMAPHPPLVPPAFYMDRYLRAAIPDPVIGDWAEPPPGKGKERGKGFAIDSSSVHLTGEALRSCRAAYYGMINHVDDQVRRLTEAANATSHGRPTVIIFTADHGEMLGDHYCFRKCYPYESSARIPLLIAAPHEAGFKTSQSVAAPVCLEDIMPTCLDLAGADVPEGVDGRSLVPLLRGETESANWRPWLHGEHSTIYRENVGNHYLVDEQYNYIWLPESGRELMFDLKRDPTERTNLARVASQQDRLATWRSRLIDELKDRPEGFVENGKLIPGRPYEAVMPHAKPN